MEKFFGLQVPLEDNIYKRAVQELEKSCGQMCVDGLAEFNRKFAGENLDVACINLRNSNWRWPAGQQNAVVSEVALVKFGNATASLLAEACGAVVTLSFCASFGWRRKLNKRVISRLAM